MPTIDAELVAPLAEHLREHGVNVQQSTTVHTIRTDGISLAVDTTKPATPATSCWS